MTTFTFLKVMLEEYKRVKNSIPLSYEPLLANRIQSLGKL
jgi:hypothetical protein